MIIHSFSLRLALLTVLISFFCYQPSFMFIRSLAQATKKSSMSRLQQVTRQMATTSVSNGAFEGVSLADLPKSNVFTTNLPRDEKFPTPADSYNASRKDLGPRMVKNALYTLVRPEEKEDPELYGVSHQAMRDIGLKSGEEATDSFRNLVSGNKIFWNPESKEGIYPWAQCYGG